MHFSDYSRSSDSSGSREARASMGRLLSYWQYYRRKIHLLWRALVICDHRGFTFHPSSNHHHYHHIIITLSSQHHHYHQIIIILPSHHHPQLVKITSLITSAGKDYISWKVLKPRREKKGGVRLWVKIDLRYTIKIDRYNTICNILKKILSMRRGVVLFPLLPAPPFLRSPPTFLITTITIIITIWIIFIIAVRWNLVGGRLSDPLLAGSGLLLEIFPTSIIIIIIQAGLTCKGYLCVCALCLDVIIVIDRYNKDNRTEKCSMQR